MRRFVLAAFVLTVLAACQPADTALSDEDIAALNNLRTSYVHAVHMGDADGAVTVHAEDIFMMPPDTPALEGRDAIRVLYEGGGDESFEMTSAKIDGQAGIAFDRGTYSLTSADDSTVELVGKYLCIAHRQADGSWLWTDTIWNTDAPGPQPEEG